MKVALAFAVRRGFPAGIEARWLGEGILQLLPTAPWRQASAFSIKLEDLADEWFVSRATLQND
ncbi:hypothetical protein FK513_30575, partial [Klebsiella pneumoniae]|nr:hypothetical protein [Klebsiella pneumoniae]